jgi:hypothetical protein
VPQSGPSAQRVAFAVAHTGAAAARGPPLQKAPLTTRLAQADARAADACCVAAEAALVELRDELRRTSVALDYSLGEVALLRAETRRASQPAVPAAFSAGRLSFPDAEAATARRAPRSSSPSKRPSSARWSGAPVTRPAALLCCRARRALADHGAAAAGVACCAAGRARRRSHRARSGGYGAGARNRMGAPRVSAGGRILRAPSRPAP